MKVLYLFPVALLIGCTTGTSPELGCSHKFWGDCLNNRGGESSLASSRDMRSEQSQPEPAPPDTEPPCP